MKFTRDAWVWCLLIAGSVFGYLATTPAPTEWSWTQWMNALVVIVGIVAGYLRQSPLDKDRSGIVTLPVGKVAIPFLLLASLALTGCAKTPPNLDPQTQKMFEATEVAKRINRLQGAVIDLEAEQVIQTDVARTIIRFTVAANQTMLDYPSGYGPLVASAWKNLKAIKDVQNVLATHPKLAAAMQLVDVALAVWLPTQEASCFWLYSSLLASPIPG